MARFLSELHKSPPVGRLRAIRTDRSATLTLPVFPFAITSRQIARPLWLGRVVLGLTLVASSGCADRHDLPRIRRLASTHAPARLEEVAPARCLPCHEAATRAWEESQHAIANRPLDPAKDRSNFGRPVADTASPYRPVASDGALRIDGPGAETATVAQGVIGVEPLVQYLIAHDDGRWQAHELAYDPIEQEWFNLFGDEERQPDEWGHWSRQGMNWNSNCAWCHMTEFEKNYDPASDTYASTWTAHGVSCVQCHPRSAEHTVAAEAGKYVSADLRKNAPQVAMETCATCHARREELTPDSFVAGDAFLDHFRPTLPDTAGIYFPDGQNLDENYVYGSLMLSRMGHAGVTCADCHDPHSHATILPVENNALCMRCHGPGENNAIVIDPLAHSHHPAESTGNQCIECHMPLRTYMARDPRRDHGLVSPDPELSLELGTPDVCTKCHADQPAQWSIEHADAWYDTPQREARRARARLLAQAHDVTQPFPTTGLLAAADAEDNVYWKSTYIRLLADGPDAPDLRDWAGAHATAAHPLVRASAVRLLHRGGAPAEQLETFLDDASRQVRWEAIEGLLERGPLPPEADTDYAAHLAANADRPSGALRMAGDALRQGDLAAARAHVERATSFDPSNPLLYFQAALLLDRGGAADLALEYLRGAPEAARRSGHVNYAQGLLWAEKGDSGRAITQLRRAVERDPTQDRWWYNLALAYTKVPNWTAAEEALNEALRLAPDNPAYAQLATQIQRLRLGSTF